MMGREVFLRRESMESKPSGLPFEVAEAVTLVAGSAVEWRAKKAM